MDKDFETKVLTRLAVIESKLDDFANTRDKTDEAFSLSKENEKEIEEIKEKLKWITRTIVGAIITGIIGILFVLIQVGMGMK